MIPGVEILSSTEVVASYKFSWITFIGIIVFMFFLVMVLPGDGITLKTKFIVALVMSICFGGFVGGLVASCAFPETYRTEYKVYITEECSMPEFLDKYVILDQEGKIITITERVDE